MNEFHQIRVDGRCPGQAAARLIRSTKSHEAPRSHTKNECLNSSYSVLFRVISWIAFLSLIDNFIFQQLGSVLSRSETQWRS